MAKKNKELTEQQKLARARKALERKQRIEREEAAKKEQEKGRNLMMSAMGAIFLATVLIIVGGVVNNQYSNMIELFAYGLTAVGGFALVLSSMHLQGSSKRWIITAGVVAIAIGLLSFLVQAIGVVA